MRAGEVAERAGVNVETLRYYERRGLLPEPGRTPNGHRDYGEETVRFVRAVKEAQELGFSLAEIEEYVRVTRSGRVAASEELRVRTAAKIDEIDARIASLRRVRDDLARIVGCACDSLDRCTCGAAYLARQGREAHGDSLLHVTNGESAGNTLRQTGLGGAVLTWQDVLHEGPVPDEPRSRLRDTRAAFLSACGWGSRRAIAAALARRDEQLVDALAGGRRVVLWFEHDLYDQLQLLDALALAAASAVDIEHLELVVVNTFLGPLTAEELESLWPQRRPATDEMLASATAAWAALRAPEPVRLAELARREDPALPFVPPALRRLLEELPGVRDGLSATERRTLEAFAAGAATPAEAFRASQSAEPAAFLGDTWFFRTLAALGQGDSRLVETTRGRPLPQPPPLGAAPFARIGVRLTPAGRRVLAGEDDRVALLGVDRWIGGTRVVPGRVWRWDADAGSLVAPD